jgi:hypothetical protein
MQIGHFEKGIWVEDGIITEETITIPLCVDFDSKYPCSEQIDRVAKLLNLPVLDHNQKNGEMIIKGASGNWYRILDFWVYLLKRME